MFTSKNIADAYDQIGLYFSATRPKLSAEVISLIPELRPKASVLDLGAGNGVLLTALPKSIDYTGIDFSQTLISEAKKLHPENKFVLADITDPTTWQDLAKYDFIAALAVFHHLATQEEQQYLLAQIKAHLKPTGNLLISVWDLNKPKFDRYRQGKHLAIPFHAGPKRFFYAFTLAELENLTKKAGFNLTESFASRNNFYLKLTV